MPQQDSQQTSFPGGTAVSPDRPDAGSSATETRFSSGEESFYRRHRILIWTFFVMIAAADIVMIRLFPFPGNDMAARYAPMTEAFAAGDWQVAFHPRFGMLFSALTGSISYLTGLNGFRSCQIAALMFFLLTVFPLWSIFRRLWDERIAAAGCLLYLMCSFLTRYVYFGLRENWKAFGIAAGVCGALAVSQAPRRWRGYLTAACGGAFLVAVRGDGAFYAMVLLLAIAYLELKSFRRIPIRSILCGLLLLLLISPQLYYNYDKLGYPVPECRHAQLLKRMGMPPWKTPEVELP